MLDSYFEALDRFWVNHKKFIYSPFPGDLIEKEAIEKLPRDYLFVRNSYDFDLDFETDWWHIVKSDIEDISKYSSNHRNQIRKGLKSVECKKVSSQEILENGYHIYFSCMKTYGMPPVTELLYQNSILVEQETSLSIDYFGVYIDEKLIGYSKNLISNSNSFVFYENIHIKPKYRKLYPNYALIHIMNKYYLNERGFGYVSDGSRTLLHPTGIQKFLISKFHFRKAYCKLQLFYSKKVEYGLIPLRIVDKISNSKLSKRSPKINAMILQDDIFRSSRTPRINE